MGNLDGNKKDKLEGFTEFVINELGIENPPTILITNSRDGLKTTASYDYQNEEKVIKICRLNRAVIDLLRSIAHELTHHKQFEDGRLKTAPPDIGGEIEDEANAKAGEFIKLYAKKDSTIYDL